MARGKVIWEAADNGSNGGTGRSANAMRFYALTCMLAEAETLALTGSDADAAEQLRELQAHAEKLVAMLAPDKKGKPSLVA
jgi:hypothetical protein